MNVAREVIVDLLPVYLSGEASPATRSLVEEYMKQDAELAQLDVSRLLPQPLQEQIARNCEEVSPHGGHLDGLGRSPHAHKRLRGDVLGFSALAGRIQTKPARDLRRVQRCLFYFFFLGAVFFLAGGAFFFAGAFFLAAGAGAAADEAEWAAWGAGAPTAFSPSQNFISASLKPLK